MSASHRLLVPAYHCARALRAVRHRLGRPSPPQLRVLIYHDIAPEDLSRFEEQLRWLGTSWRFVTPEQFAAMITGAAPIVGRNLLLTFDDGYASNRAVAEAVLRPMRISALFFVVPGFTSLEDPEATREFIASRILPGARASELPSHLRNMRWSDLEALLEQGHSVGAHTETHARLSGIRSHGDLTSEIVTSADLLSRRLGVSIDHFAYPFGDLASLSEHALDIARSRFCFVYSGLRGDNAGGVSPFALRRDAINPGEPRAILGAWVEGAADLRYARSRGRLDRWAALS